MITLKIGENEKNQRLDRFLKKYFKNATLSYIYKAIRKDIKLNGKRGKPETLLELDDEIQIYIPEEKINEFTKTNKRQKVKKSFKVAYEDENILIVYKPSGILTHGTKEEKKNHLTNQVISYLIEKGDFKPSESMTFNPSPVNRLDRNTEGLVIFAKKGETLQVLNEMMRRKNCIKKYYLTVVRGELDKEIHLKGYLSKLKEKNMVKVIDEKSNLSAENNCDSKIKEIETIAKPVFTKDGYTLVEVELITGRTHQIRAHLSSIGLVILGDGKYGDFALNKELKELLKGRNQLLDAYRLEIDNSIEPLGYLSGSIFKGFISSKYKAVLKELFGDEIFEVIEL